MERSEHDLSDDYESGDGMRNLNLHDIVSAWNSVCCFSLSIARLLAFIDGSTILFSGSNKFDTSLLLL